MERSRTIAGAVLSVGLVAACTRANPAYDPDGDEPWATDAATTALDAGTTDEPVGTTAAGDPGDPGDPGADADGVDDADDAEGSSGTSDGADEPAQPDEPLDDRLLYSTLDSQQAVVAPAAGTGPGALSPVPPQLVDGELDGAMRFSQPGQWVAFPQRSEGIANIDHRAGVLEIDVRFELAAPHLPPADLIALSGVVADGGGLRMGVTDVFDGNHLWVGYNDAQGEEHATRFGAGLLPAGQWVHLTLAWQADVAEGEPNVSLWIDGAPIDPLPGFAAGPKEVGDPSDADVILLGSWSLFDRYPAQASFDELQIFAGG